jgi:DNA-binding response OmpR family regulator
METNLLLLVEDDPSHAELITRANLSRHTIVWVADGEAALDYLHRRGAYDDAVRPTAVLLDLRLPRRTGLEVLREIRATDDLRHMPVIVLTSSSAERDVNDAYRCGANSYLVKPMGFSALRDLVTSLTAYWLDYNRVPGT